MVKQINDSLLTLKTLPNGVEIDIAGLDGFEELLEDQKIFLTYYFDSFPQKMVACLKSGISKSKTERWFNENETFRDLMNMIKVLHRESLAEVQYKDSYVNPTIRSGTLKALDAEGYERKEKVNNTTNNTLVLQGSFNDLMKQIPKGD